MEEETTEDEDQDEGVQKTKLTKGIGADNKDIDNLSSPVDNETYKLKEIKDLELEKTK